MKKTDETGDYLEVTADVATHLWNCMREKNMTPAALAELAGVSVFTVAKLLSGETSQLPNTSTLVDIFAALDYRIRIEVEQVF